MEDESLKCCQNCGEPFDEHGCIECCGYDKCEVCERCVEDCYRREIDDRSNVYEETGYNFSSVTYYCADCVPDEVKEETENERAEEIAWRIQTSSESCSVRREKLISALKLEGLDLREDSKLCDVYISRGDVDIDFVVRRMCEMKCLFEYHNMREILNSVAEDHCQTLEAGYFPDMSVMDEAEGTILSSIGGYPSIWPWQRDNI